MARSPRRRKLSQSISHSMVGVATLLMLLLVMFASKSSRLDRLGGFDDQLLDFFWAWRNNMGYGPEYQLAGEEVLVITLDSESLQNNEERWPWSFETYALLVESLLKSGAVSIAIDLPFRRFIEAPPWVTRALLNPKVYLGAAHEVDGRGRQVARHPLIDPEVEIPKEAEMEGFEQSIGTTAVYLGVDGVVRYIYPVYESLLRLPGEMVQVPLVHLSVLAYTRSRELREARLSPPEEQQFLILGEWLKVPLVNNKLPINYGLRPWRQTDQGGTLLAGGVRSYAPSISYREFQELSDAERRESVEGRIVLVGLTAIEEKRWHHTPVGVAVPGIFIQAEILASLLEQKFVIRTDRLDEFLLVLGLGLAVCWAFPRLGQTRGFTAVVLLTAGWLLLVLYLFFHRGRLLPVLTPSLAMLLPALLMSAALNRENERDKAQIRQMFGEYLSPKVVDNLLRMKNRGELGLTGRKLKLTVFYSDIRGFTKMSEKLDPFRVVSLLNEHFEYMTQQAFRHDAYVDKFIGDSLMAVFSAPTPRADDALRAVRMALDMQSQMVKLQALREQRGDPSYHIGIGIHTGPVVLGNIGSSVKMDYTVIGDVVNTTSRLCDAAKPGQILISEATYLEVAQKVEVRELEPLSLKGISEPLKIYEVVGIR